MTHSFPFEQFQCDARPRRDETKPSHATVVLPSWGRKPTKRQEQKRWDRACGVRELSPALCVAGMSSLPSLPPPLPPPHPPLFSLPAHHYSTCVIRTTVAVAVAASRLSSSPFRRPLPQGRPSFFSAWFSGIRCSLPTGKGGCNSRRRCSCAPQHA